MEERKDERANLSMISAQSRTSVPHHPEFLEHIPKSASDYENPGRVTRILEKLTGAGSRVLEHEITTSQAFERAKLDLLSQIHSTEYLNFVNELSKDLERQHKELNGDSDATEEVAKKPTVVPFTPMVSDEYRGFYRLSVPMD